MFKVNNESTKTICEIWSKLTIKTPKWRQRRFGVFIVNFEQIPHCSTVSFDNFEQDNASQVPVYFTHSV